MKAPLKKFFSLFNYNEQRRRIDVKILWAACKANAADINHARIAFALHAMNNEAWKSLGKDEIQRRIKELS